jgi:hypothetical protein
MMKTRLPGKPRLLSGRWNRPITGPLPHELQIVLANEIYIPKDGLPPALRNRLIRLAAFQNPEFYRAQSMRLPTYEKPRVIGCARDYHVHTGLPRGCLEDALQLFRDLKIRVTVSDERQSGRVLDARFRGELRPEQKLAADALLAFDTGVLSATTAFGKTVVASWLVAERRVSTLDRRTSKAVTRAVGGASEIISRFA